MAQWWHASVVHQHPHQHVTAYSSLQTCTRITWRSFPSSAGWECLIVPKSTPELLSTDVSLPSAPISRSISCFCDDDPFVTEHFFNKDGRTLTLRTKLEIMYSPWAMSMLNGYQIPVRKSFKELTGGPTGGGRGGDGDGGGDGGGGGGDEGKEEQVWLLPFLTIAFAAFHLGYCIAIWMKDGSFDFEFVRTGIGLFCLLALAAIRLNNRTGIDAYLLGLGASVGVMLWTGERCLMKKEGSPAGIVSFFAAAMAALFSTAIHETIRRHF
ncbi:hypothetical protein L7F22_005520 [Adiantum nelumboides]|nr:hypothetical protein [Adiantum nelumboides]